MKAVFGTGLRNEGKLNTDTYTNSGKLGLRVLTYKRLALEVKTVILYNYKRLVLEVKTGNRPNVTSVK